MKKTLGLLLALTVLAGIASAADKPNFGGTWKMNLAKSNFGPVPGPASMSRVISHAEPQIVIVEEQVGDGGAQNTTRKYTTDGSATSFESQGAAVTSSAKWDGNALVVISEVSAIGLTYNDRMTLSEDGKTLTSTLKISSAQGGLDLIVVFERQ